MLAGRHKPVTMRHPDPFPASAVAAAKDHAIAEYPRECCGFVVESDGEITYQPVANTHETPEEAFRADPMVTRQLYAEHKVLALVHSHPDGPNHPSVTDQENQIESGLTWGVIPVIGTNVGDDIVPVASDILWWGDDLTIPPLERRKFIWGIFHCYALYRDWWRLERGVTIPNFACPDDFIDVGYSIFVDNCERAGLRNLGKVDMSDLQIGDMLVGHVKGTFPNHCGVYLGGDDFLHHAPGVASGKAELLRWWPHIDTVFRYEPADASSLRGLG